MKHTAIYQKVALHLLAGVVAILGLVACEEYPDAYQSTGGTPEILYVRLPNAEKADSVLTEAYMGNMICLIGNNLRSIHELYFNDLKAVLNTSFMTDNAIIVTVPNNIPDRVDNKIYMVTTSGDTVSFDFGVKVPDPVVGSISCEYLADGEIATLYGDYFIDDINQPLTITFEDVAVDEIISIDKTQVSFRIPEGATKGYIDVTTIYGTGRSHFQFRDDRGILLDFDKLLVTGGGWRKGNTAQTDGISGNYLVFKGDLTSDSWEEDNFSLNLWQPEGGAAGSDLFDVTDADNLQLKFEINVLAPWSCNALQILFTPWGTADNGFYGDTNLGRALWIPWAGAGSYVTKGWTTVSIPLSDFKFTSTGAASEPLKSGACGSLSLFVWSGGVAGASCSPEMWLDNIRVVPIE